MLSTFLVDGLVAGAWEAPLRGPAVMTLTSFGSLSARHRRAVEREGEGLLDWLRPGTPSGGVAWKPE